MTKEELESLKTAKYILWDYVEYEGWAPTPINSLDEAPEVVSKTMASDLGISFLVVTSGVLSLKVVADDI